jgi:hypothetical protein
MHCEYCDRSNVLRAYCYFKSRPTAFSFITAKEFTLESFAEYAIANELHWKIALCETMGYAKAGEFWEILKPVLTKALQESKS